MRNLAKYTTTLSPYRVTVCKRIFTDAYIKGSISMNQRYMSWTVVADKELVISHMLRYRSVTFYMQDETAMLTMYTQYVENYYCYSICGLLRELLALEPEKVKPKSRCYIL